MLRHDNASKNTQIVAQIGKYLFQRAHGAIIHVGVEVANVKQRVAIKRGRQLLEADIVVPNLHARGVGPSTPIQSRQLEEGADDGMNRIPVLDVEESESLAENLSFVIRLIPRRCLAYRRPPRRWIVSIIVYRGIAVRVFHTREAELTPERQRCSSKLLVRLGVWRDKAALFSGCKSHPANAPIGLTWR